jgi:Zn-dependent protease
MSEERRSQLPTAPDCCPSCGTQLAPALLSCPGCQRLVHADQLKVLAAGAEQATEEGEPARALELWREALELLPPGTRQRDVVAAQVAALQRECGEPAPADRPRAGPAQQPAGANKKLVGGLGVLGAAGLLLWKLKFVLVFVLGKVKLLALGLTKAGTFLSMFLALGVYWAAFGWKFAAGLIGSIYIHEMGHVAALRQRGIRASAPMFIPGLGAFVRLKDYPKDAHDDALVGLAGPIWGLGAALGAYLVHLALGWPTWAAITRVGAWINLLNLLPVWQLDGGRAFRALSRAQRWMASGALLLAWVLSTEGLLLLLLVVAAAQSLLGQAPAKPDRGVLVRYLVLVAALSYLSTIPVATGP